ncbi:DEAD/DEAH box RNA helicase [Achlya hypogyna]|uniref:DEAD/DEAH box RNA helicase n=1 Tax=Achlya hypogyna TaxID=1202772 RepID=A0A1V9Z8P8_ACHHY|nr:DEAD/DEAH box RNA helicase [Achlya hypogyna]
MSKRKVAPELDPVAALWLQRFTVLDSSYCFLAQRKALTSLKNVLSLAGHLAPATPLLEGHVRQLATIGVVHVVSRPSEKVILQDDFDPTELPDKIDMVEFPAVPHASKRGSSKRLELFRAALAAYDVTVNAVPEYAPPARVRPLATWTRDTATADTVDKWIAALVASPFYTGQLVHVERVPAKPAIYGATQLADLALAPGLVESLHIDKLFAHQSTGIAALLRGDHVAISTSTSSGKSMVYNIPVAHALLSDPHSRHLYLFPTKALAQDQLQSLASFLGRCGLPQSVCATYDGDTAHPQRSALRQAARVFLTNPDMLHVTILPQHKAWEPVLAHLRYIVIDESHMYRGVFGAHVAWVLRRLRRLCFMYGSDPQVVCCSASIHNPAEHFRYLVPEAALPGQPARPLTLVRHTDDGAPAGARAFAVWNPLAHDADAPDASNSAIFQASQLLARLVALDVHTIAFCRGRKLTELVLDYTHTLLRKAKLPALVPKVKAYRGGYTADDRRGIETSLFAGDLLGVVATNALELGIDIGSLESTLHVGFPSSVSSLWQQAGRAGRGGKDALAVIVGFNSPLDQYYLASKKRCVALFSRDFEAAVLDAENPHVMAAHLQCASLELRLFSAKSGTNAVDRAIFPAAAEVVVQELRTSGRLSFADGFGYQVPALLAAEVKTATQNIRTIGADEYKVVEGETVLDSVPATRVFFQLYPRAVYLFQGREYVVTKVDTEAKLAFVARSARRLKYYTAAQDFTDVNVSLPFPVSAPPYHPSVHLGRVSATTHVVGCHLIEKRTQKVTGHVEFSLPPMDATGHGVWVDVPESVLAQLPRESHRHAVHGVNHLVLAVVPHFVLLDPHDLRTEHANFRETRARPTRLVLYESHDGGVGIVARLARLLPQILTTAKEILDACACANGCPSCIQSPECSEYNGALDKAGSKAMLDCLHTLLST